MKLKALETQELPLWNYTRFEYDSSILNQTTKVGRLLPVGLPLDSTRGTLYLLHGGAGDDRELITSGLLEYLNHQSVELIKANALQIVLPFIARSFLHDHTADPNKRYASAFLKEVLPFLEQFTNTMPETRVIAGYSMGGQAALSTFFQNPDLFCGVGAHFPSLITFDYENQNEIADLITKQPLNHRPLLADLIEGHKSAFASRSSFLTHDPLVLSKKIPLSLIKSKLIYFDVGSDDEFGLADGNQKLHKILKSRNISHCFECVPKGKHDPQFLVQQMPKMIEYLLKK